MGRYTRALGRPQPAKTFTIPESMLPMDWRRGDKHRRFTIRKLFGNEVEGSDSMILRSICRVGGRPLPRVVLDRWWRDIGPKARAGVRLCFYAVHNPAP